MECFETSDKVYDSTNKYMRFAIERMCEFCDPVDQGHISQWYDNLLPIELKEIRFEQAIRIMENWKNIFFQNKGSTNLIKTGADFNAWMYGVNETRNKSTVKTFSRIHDFLTWFPCDSLNDYQDLANAFRDYHGANRWSSNYWGLFNFVDVDTGIPDSWWVHAGHYGRMIVALTHLAKLENPTDPSVSENLQFAQRFVNGLWDGRFDKHTYLLPDTITPIGPLPGDLSRNTKKYMSSTDSLLYVRSLLEAYQLIQNQTRKDLQPPSWQDAIANLLRWIFGEGVAICFKVRIRKRRIRPLLTRGFPDRWLAMALLTTLDWVEYGYVPRWRHFVGKIHYDGTRGTDDLSHDSKWNTLYPLIEAYRITHDEFYLDIFDKAWNFFKESEIYTNYGLFPSRIESGSVPSQIQSGSGVSDNIDTGQDVFLDIIVRAYNATVEAGNPRPQYLDDAEALADRIIEEYNTSSGQPPLYFNLSNGIVIGAFLRLALARGTLRRIEINFSQNYDSISIQPVNVTNPNAESITVNINGKNSAIIYMDDGDYNITVDGTVDRVTTSLTVSGNTSIGFP